MKRRHDTVFKSSLRSTTANIIANTDNIVSLYDSQWNYYVPEQFEVKHWDLPEVG